MTTWQEEARGVEPWAGCVLLGGGRCSSVYWGVVEAVDDRLAGVVDTTRFPCRVENAPPPDLRDADTCAAFDRRLALRLGAPEEAVREGVVVFSLDEMWHIYAGSGASRPRWAWAGYGDEHGPRLDPLLFRVRAWKGVKP